MISCQFLIFAKLLDTNATITAVTIVMRFIVAHVRITCISNILYISIYASMMERNWIYLWIKLNRRYYCRLQWIACKTILRPLFALNNKIDFSPRKKQQIIQKKLSNTYDPFWLNVDIKLWNWQITIYLIAFTWYNRMVTIFFPFCEFVYYSLSATVGSKLFRLVICALFSSTSSSFVLSFSLCVNPGLSPIKHKTAFLFVYTTHSQVQKKQIKKIYRKKNKQKKMSFFNL